MSKIRVEQSLRTRVALVCALLTSLCLPQFVRAKPSSFFDEDFGNRGVVFTDFGGRYDQAGSVIVQGDGRIVVGGSSSPVGNQLPADFALARYNADGTLDQSFSGGTILTNFGADEVLHALAQQKDGKIVAVGTSTKELEADFALARYNQDGTLDGSFGQNGKVKTDLSGSLEAAYGVTIQSDDKIVAVGWTRCGYPDASKFAIARYNPDGTLDQSFGTGGRVVTDFSEEPGSSRDQTIAHSVAVDREGRIIVVGNILRSFDIYDFLVARYDSVGNLDPTFGDAGKVLTDFGVPSEASKVIILPDNRILVGGTLLKITDLDIDKVAIARYKDDGTLDPTFGENGLASSTYGGRSSVAFSMAVQQNSKIVMAGETFRPDSFNNFAIIRFLNDGQVDPSFGNGGSIETDLSGGGTCVIYAIAVQPDGRIVAVGSSSDLKSPLDFAVVRYLGDPVVPRITSASKQGKKLFVEGDHFDPGAKILINGEKQKTRFDSFNELLAKKAGKKINSGDSLQVQNSDGTQSEPFRFP